MQIGSPKTSTASGSTAATAVCLLALLGGALAGFKTDCYNPSTPALWSNSDRRVSGVYSDLSGCQLSKYFVGFEGHANDIRIGGKGGAAIVGVSTDGMTKSDGCTDGTMCMAYCQALCCLVPSCRYATVREDKKTVDYVAYKKEEIVYYCRMYSSGTLKDSGSQSTCTRLSYGSPSDMQFCYSLTAATWGFDQPTTDVIRNDNAQATCSRRRLQAFNPPNITPPSQISATLAAWSAEIDAKFGVLEAALKRLVESGKLASKIQESGVCAYAYPRLFGRKG